MSKFDLMYNELVQKIINEGIWDKGENVRARWADGTPAYSKSIFVHQFRIPRGVVPIITTKKVAWKTAIKEILWIWQLKDNNVQTLRDMGVHIWDEWELPDGSIGKAYGYQLGKKVFALNDNMVDQVDYLLYNLKHNPVSRRHIVTLWSIEDLQEMSLTPCCYETQWVVTNGELNLFLNQRSGDVGLGVVFNTYQYWVLLNMIAQVTGYKVGEMVHNIVIPHIYDRHIEPLQEQIKRPTYDEPQFWINPDVKDFYSFKIDDFKLIDYKHGEKIDMEVAI